MKKILLLLALLSISGAMFSQKLEGKYDNILTGSEIYSPEEYITFNGSRFSTPGIHGLPIDNSNGCSILFYSDRATSLESFWEGTVRKLSQGRYKLTLTNLKDPKGHWKKNALNLVRKEYILIQEGDLVYIEGERVKDSGVYKRVENVSAEEDAANGDVKAMWKLGNEAYENKDYDKAVKLYKKAADGGYSNAQNDLAWCYCIGNGVEKNMTTAVYWWRKSAEQGNKFGQRNLADCYYEGKGVAQDYAEAVNWYEEAAEQGLAEAQYKLGYCYENGIGCNKDYVPAIHWYLQAMNQHYVKAFVRCAYMHAYGKTLFGERNKSAVEFIDDAIKIEPDNIDYIDSQGEIHFIFGDRDFAKKCWEKVNQMDPEYYKKNNTKLVTYLKEAEIEEENKKTEMQNATVNYYKETAEDGYTDALAKLGDYYSLKKDYAEAVKWYQMATDKKNEIGQYKLGYCYEMGNGVPQNYAEAAKWYQMAAKKGYVYAMYRLANCYYYGNGVNQSYKDAVKWYKKVAEYLDLPAERDYWYSRNGIMPQYWWDNETEKVNVKAQCMLGDCYLNGIGVGKNQTMAVVWYRYAAQRGDETAQKNLQRLGESW